MKRRSQVLNDSKRKASPGFINEKMSKTRQIVVLPGDGIGPEVTMEALKILHWFNQGFSPGLQAVIGDIGGGSIDKHGVPLSDATLQKCREADAILLAALRRPQSDQLEYN